MLICPLRGSIQKTNNTKLKFNIVAKYQKVVVQDMAATCSFLAEMPHLQPLHMGGLVGLCQEEWSVREERGSHFQVQYQIPSWPEFHHHYGGHNHQGL